MIETSKSIFNETLKLRVCFLDHFLKILQFWLPVMSSTQMKVNSKWKIEVKYSLLKLLSQSFEILHPRGGVIIPKMSQKVSERYFMYQYWQKDKNQKQRELLGEVFVYETIFSKSWNSISTELWRHHLKLGQKTQTCISCTAGGKKY